MGNRAGSAGSSRPRHTRFPHHPHLALMGDVTADEAAPMGGYELKLWVVLESLLMVHFPWSDKRVTGAVGASHRAFPLPPDSRTPPVPPQPRASAGLLLSPGLCFLRKAAALGSRDMWPVRWSLSTVMASGSPRVLSGLLSPLHAHVGS